MEILNMNGLIGYTGFVGSNLLDQLSQPLELFNSTNISEIDNKHFENLYCCGLPGAKWLANRNSNNDLKNVLDLEIHLNTVTCDNFFLVSSQDCNSTMTSDETFSCLPPTAYGKNRLSFEGFCTDHFTNVYILRIGSLFGKNLKKNVIYDLLNKHYLENIQYDYTLQLYNLDNLLEDFNYMVANDIHLINRFSEPVKLTEIINIFNSCGYDYHFNLHLREDISYKNKGLLLPKEQLLLELKKFITEYHT
jgi:nucleoside-diphosphate-sugar epimerase